MNDKNILIDKSKWYDTIPYIDVSFYMRNALRKFQEYCEKNIDNIARTYRRSGMLEVWTNDYKRIIFMDEVIFRSWCMGRTYKFLNGGEQLCRSGTVLMECKDE